MTATHLPVPMHFLPNPTSSIFPQIAPMNFFLQNPNMMNNLNMNMNMNFSAQKAANLFYNHHISEGGSSSLDALEKFSKAFRRPELHIEKLASESPGRTPEPKPTISNVIPSRNRYGRPYISGRPLLTCDRQKIVECYKRGMKKIHIAKQLGITHSCVSKVLRRYAETGEIVAKACRTASCSCPGSAEEHDARYCRHLQDNKLRLFYSVENILRQEKVKVVYYSKKSMTSPTPSSKEEFV